MAAHLHPSIWTLEVDGKPTLAFEARKYREANELCHEDWLRVELACKNSMASRCAVPTQT
jgi:hypothetical protein